MKLTKEQLTVIESSLESSLFLEGPAGSGKTTTGIERLSYFMHEGIPGRSILLFFPQRNLGAQYQKSINRYSAGGHSLPVLATYGGLARRVLDLFWPSILSHFPQLQPVLQPTFLTLESSLYFLSRVVEPLIVNEGFFSTVVIQRNRLYSQILDNLNKSAVHAFPHSEISDRLISSWIGDPSQTIIYHQAQQAANIFREYCYQNNLLDYSLQIELFTQALDQIPLLEEYISNQFDFLIYDNCEEDVPVSHDFILKLAPQLKSSLIIYDRKAGYRSFLGASPESAKSIAGICSDSKSFDSIFSSSPALQQFNASLSKEIHKETNSEPIQALSIEPVFSINYQSSYPELTAWVGNKIHSLISSGVPPGEIVILAPFLSDSLRFLLLESLSKHSVTASSHRPSRALRDEPVTQTLLTLSALAHPAWEITPSRYELSLALVQAIEGLDLTRAYLLADQATKISPEALVRLAEFDDISPSYHERISYTYGNLYQGLLDWLNIYASEPALPLDHFLTHLFGEILTLPGYGFSKDLVKGRNAAQIIESIRNFRQSAGKVLDYDHLQLGKEYYRMVKTGVLANQYMSSWTDLPDNEVLIAPAYTFLLNNRPVDYQFWLDIGSRGWYERIYQPLTNPHVLQRDWPRDQPWTDDEEQDNKLASLDCLTTGLIHRCRKSIFGCLTETDERGHEQKGYLLISLNKILLENLASNSLPEKSQNGR